MSGPAHPVRQWPDAAAALLFDYRGARYPSYLRDGNAMQYIAPVAKQFCRGIGLDVGAGPWPLPGARPVDRIRGNEATALPDGLWDYVFSSHCLEHLGDPAGALAHWRSRIRPGGVLFLYLPHPDMEYWRPANCRKHLHIWTPAEAAVLVADAGFRDVLHSERDLMWSFAVVGFRSALEMPP